MLKQIMYTMKINTILMRRVVLYLPMSVLESVLVVAKVLMKVLLSQSLMTQTICIMKAQRARRRYKPNAPLKYFAYFTISLTFLVLLRLFEKKYQRINIPAFRAQNNCTIIPNVPISSLVFFSKVTGGLVSIIAI